MKSSMFDPIMSVSNYKIIRSEHSSVRIYLERLEWNSSAIRKSWAGMLKSFHFITVSAEEGMKGHLKTQHSLLGMHQRTRGCSGRNFSSSKEPHKNKRNKKVKFLKHHRLRSLTLSLPVRGFALLSSSQIK